MHVQYVPRAQQLEQYGHVPQLPAQYEPMAAVVVSGLEPEEPVFVLRARDALAVAVVNHYRVVSEGLFSTERSLELEADIQKMIDWRHEHVDLLRDPD